MIVPTARGMIGPSLALAGTDIPARDRPAPWSCASPPRTWPIGARARSNGHRVTPPPFMVAPASETGGSAVRSASRTGWATISGGRVPATRMPATGGPDARAMGRPVAIRPVAAATTARTMAARRAGRTSFHGAVAGGRSSASTVASQNGDGGERSCPRAMSSVERMGVDRVGRPRKPACMKAGAARSWRLASTSRVISPARPSIARSEGLRSLQMAGSSKATRGGSGPDRQAASMVGMSGAPISLTLRAGPGREAGRCWNVSPTPPASAQATRARRRGR